MGLKAGSRPPMEGESRERIHSRALDSTLRVRDARVEIARASRRVRNTADEVRAFLESKRQLVRSHAHLTASQKARALAEIDRVEPGAGSSDAEPAVADGDAGGVDGGDDDPPLPGGVGFGVFYDPAYKAAFESGTAVELSILCPTRLGGNVDTWLYLTAMNRASRGAEAFVAYHAQDELRFKVFDWARRDPWQVDLPLSSLRPYLHEIEVDGTAHPAVHVLNVTIAQDGSTWTNEAYLHNHALGSLDLVYAHDYVCGSGDQNTGWTGSWGPIVETFQDRHEGTHPVGFASVSVASCFRDEWDEWLPLSPANTYLQQDDAGFRILHLDPNHTFVAGS